MITELLSTASCICLISQRPVERDSRRAYRWSWLWGCGVKLIQWGWSGLPVSSMDTQSPSQQENLICSLWPQVPSGRLERSLWLRGLLLRCLSGKKNVHKQLLKCVRAAWFPPRPLEDLLWARHTGPNVAKLLIHFWSKVCTKYKQKPKAILLMLLIKNKHKKNYFQ